jgi:hypothetical protein
MTRSFPTPEHRRLKVPANRLPRQNGEATPANAGNLPQSCGVAESFQRETKMRNLLIAMCCAALMGSMSVATAQTSGPTQNSMNAHNPMDSNAKMKKKHAKKSMKSDDSMKDDMSKEGMKKDTK